RPREELVLFEAAARRLGGFDRVTSLTLHPELETWLFDSDSRSDGVIAGWSRDGRSGTLVLDSGAPIEVDDAWGRTRPVHQAPEGVAIPFGETPVYIRHPDARRIRLLDSFALDKPDLTASIQRHTRTLTLLNTGVN